MSFKTLLLIAAAAFQLACKPEALPPIKIGVLHSLSGTMAAAEKPAVDAVLLAVEEVNRSGGVQGRRLEPVVVDGRSDPDVFQREAQRLITQEHVAAIFGCWSLASRRAVRPIVEKYDSLLFYPAQNEGLEQSPNIVYLGAAPNQHTFPALTWAYSHLGKRFFLVGSDQVYPRMVNLMARDVLRYLGGQVVGEKYIPLGGSDFAGVAEAIKKAKPDVILNTIRSAGIINFFEALRDAGISPDQTAVFSLTLDEAGVKTIMDHIQSQHPKEAPTFLKKHLAGTYACWNYFESIDNPANAAFVKKFKKKYGEDYRVTDAMEAAYIGVHLWSEALNECTTIERPSEILYHLAHLSMPAPEGVVTIDNNTNHARKTIRIGRLNQAGAFDILWTSKRPLSPAPYPPFMGKAHWEGLLDRLYLATDSHRAAGAPRDDSEGGL
ncbi:MAG: urea ABC transporter substrate-binding protein [Elusimicrobia bacterium]|nr:urea ABC transporter substrate-binding protein [Elusimicrobiota bacterium]